MQYLGSLVIGTPSAPWALVWERRVMLFLFLCILKLSEARRKVTLRPESKCGERTRGPPHSSTHHPGLAFVAAEELAVWCSGSPALLCSALTKTEEWGGWDEEQCASCGLLSLSDLGGLHTLCQRGKKRGYLRHFAGRCLNAFRIRWGVEDLHFGCRHLNRGLVI